MQNLRAASFSVSVMRVIWQHPAWIQSWELAVGSWQLNGWFSLEKMSWKNLGDRFALTPSQLWCISLSWQQSVLWGMFCFEDRRFCFFIWASSRHVCRVSQLGGGECPDPWSGTLWPQRTSPRNPGTSQGTKIIRFQEWKTNLICNKFSICVVQLRHPYFGTVCFIVVKYT